MITVEGRGAGVAIVRRSGRFIGRTIRVGTGWQAWRLPAGSVELAFIGWAPTRRDAVAKITG